jgi:XTP/dITP diphosphohydrolase
MIQQPGDDFKRLVSIMDELREKCPWDKKQTIHSLRQMTIEETYELADAVTEENWEGIREELGDLLLHIVFYARIASEQKKFELDEVIHDISEKLIARHPHIYGNVVVKDEEDVKKNWEKLKLKEGKTSILEGLPKALPSTVKAMRLQEKAKQVGFEWENKEQVWEKVEEEVGELKRAIENESGVAGAGSENRDLTPDSQVEEEFGDLMFSLINYARFLRVDAENALEKANKKFIHRFTQMEQVALQQGKDLPAMTLHEMDAIWNNIKQKR